MRYLCDVIEFRTSQDPGLNKTELESQLHAATTTAPKDEGGDDEQINELKAEMERMRAELDVCC